MAQAALDEGPSNVCLTKMVAGERQHVLPNQLAEIKGPFIMSQHLPLLLEGLDPEAPPEVVTGGQMVDWLPDLSDKGVGLRRIVNPYQVLSRHLSC